MDRGSTVVLTLALVAIGVAVTGAVTTARSPIRHRVVDRSLDLRGVRRLELRSGSTDFGVARGSGGGAHLHLDLRGTRVDDVAIAVERTGDVLRLIIDEQPHHDAGGWSMQSSSAGIVVGAPVDVAVTTGSGDVLVTDPPGAVSGQTGSGDVKIIGARGDVSGRTGSGDVAVTVDPAYRGSAIDLHTGSGEVQLIVPRGFRGDLQTHTASGTVQNAARITAAATPAVRLETASGNIQIATH
jgi:hypothetical protein